jgi:hypothetical protein
MLIRLLELSPYEYQNCFNINESYTVNIKERYTDFRTQTILMDHVSLWHTLSYFYLGTMKGKKHK